MNTTPPRLPGRPSFVLLLAALLAGCSAMTQSQDNVFEPEREEQLRIEVRNFHFSEATLWTTTPSEGRSILGRVEGKNTQTFTIPWSRPQELAIEIDLLADQRCLTRRLHADPGDFLELQIDVDSCRG